ncbi:MAG: hypothetical protein FWE28_07050 [Oscillospiraceae bacterium]|nr:hypothetical protein [Oscillospiraceae bacterium]
MSKTTHFFLGANAPTGFYSLYDQLADPVTDERLYIVKGGSGCGKSSFMKAIAKGLTDAGLDVEHIHCSADPDSIDAIYIPAHKTAYVDGTAPHIIEPAYMAVFEQYLNLGRFYNAAALRPSKENVMNLVRTYKTLYSRAYDCIAAADNVMVEATDLVVDTSVIAAIKKRTRGIISREIGKKRNNTPGRARRRFLTALTHRGFVARFDTVQALAERVYHLDNHLGLAHHMLEDVAEAALGAGHDVFLCPSPLRPDMLEHLIIPALSLAFVSSNNQTQYEGESYRHIRLDAMADGERLKSRKTRLRFSKKVAALLLAEAVSTLGEAKALHDRLERIYNPHVDFDGVYQLAEEHLKQLLAEVMSVTH